MRLLQVMAGAEQGGAETYFLDSVVALHEAGVAQRVITRDNNTFRLETMRDLGIPVDIATFSRWWRLPTALTVRKAIREFTPDLVQYRMGRAGGFALSSMRERNIAWYGGYYKTARFQNCAWHVGVTGDLTRHIEGEGIDPARVALVHTYADFTESQPVPRSRFDTPEDVPLILALARLHWKKGLDVLLDALVDVPEAHLWIAGDGPLREDLEAQMQRLGLQDRVRFLGWSDERGGLLASCDVVAFPSRYEPFGTVTIEAWAAGRPLVAAASAGPKAYVRNGEDGLMVEIDDRKGLAEALARVIREPDLKARLVDQGTKRYHADFTKEAFLRDSFAFYDKVLSAAGGPVVSA